MSIVSLGDRTPEHLLSFMKGLLPGEDKSKLFRYIWLNALPESVHQSLAADKGDLGVLASKATKMLKENTRQTGQCREGDGRGPVGGRRRHGWNLQGQGRRRLHEPSPLPGELLPVLRPRAFSSQRRSHPEANKFGEPPEEGGKRQSRPPVARLTKKDVYPSYG